MFDNIILRPLRSPVVLLHAIISIALLLAISCSIAFAVGEDTRVVILNSDMSIDGRYMSAQTSFISGLPSLPADNLKAFDLGKKWFDHSGMARDIAAFDADFIYCIGSDAYKMGLSVPGNHTLIFSSLINWRRLPFGEKTYGIANEVAPGDQLQIFQELVPQLHTIGILYSSMFNREYVEVAIKAAAERGIRLIPIEIKAKGESREAIFKNFAQLDALWLIADPLAISSFQDIDFIFAQSALLKKPVFAWQGSLIRHGAIITVEPNTAAIGHQAAQIIKKLNAEGKITEKVQAPSKNTITINVTRAEELGIRLNTPKISSGFQIH
ncbi:MAG: hypothetical protein KJ950_11020 [Proteobacteria bacterium]|nr:hypothetical protein [Pseudomonadota bacterium]MBU1687710.1 hypothetical protein [Pseudomonadota bacterium]